MEIVLTFLCQSEYDILHGYYETCIVHSPINMGLKSLLKLFIIIRVSVPSVNCSCIDVYIGDGVCDDENNHPDCDHDGGRSIYIQQ